MKTAPPLRLSHGFSLVETLVALGILSTALVGSLGLLASGLSAASESFTRTRGSMIALSLAEDVRADRLDLPSIAASDNARFVRPTLPIPQNDPMPHVVFMTLSESGKVIETTLSNTVWDEGSPDTKVGFLARVEILPESNPPLQYPTGNAFADGQARSNDELTSSMALGGLGAGPAPYPGLASRDPLFDPTVPGTVTGLRLVSIKVESPASAPAGRRTSHGYTFQKSE